MKRLWQILLTPSAAESPHHRAAVGAWHALAGMIPGVLLAFYGWWSAILAFVISALAYFALKELGDLRRGGTLRDGIEDSTCVAFGCWAGWAMGPDAWWPIIALNGVIFALFALAEWREGGQ